MDLTLTIKLLVLLSLGISAAIGLAIRTGRISEFYVAGREVGAVWNGVGVAVSLVLPLGLVSVAVHQGKSQVLVFGFGGAAGLLLSAICFAPYLRKFGGYTLPDFLGERFGGTPARIASVLLLILCSFPLLVASVYELGLAGSQLFGVELVMSSIVAAALPLISTVFGGMRAVSVTQVAQGVLLLLATLAALAIFKGQHAVQDQGGITAAIEAFSLRDRTDQVALLVSLIAGAASLPHLLMHSFLTPKVDGARISFLWAGLFTAVLGVAAAAYPGLLAAMGLDADRPLAAYVLCIAVIAACLALATGLLAAIANTLAYDLYFKTFDRTATTTRQLLVARGALVVVAAFVGFSALEAGSAAAGLAAASFSLAASSFFPALVLGLWWPRVNAAGALAGMAAGLLLCLYYLLVPHYLPVLFYDTTSVFSNASPEQAAHYAILRQAYLLAGGAAEQPALAAWVEQARALANWGGVDRLFAALFAVPFGFVVTIVVSLLTPAPSADVQSFVAELRKKPKA